MANPLTQFLRRQADKINRKDPLMIHSYEGFASTSRLFLQGRVLENEGILLEENQSKIRTLIDNFRRFESDEIQGAKVRIEIGQNVYELLTDEEGYFTLDTAWTPVDVPANYHWHPATITLLDQRPAPPADPVQVHTEVLCPGTEAELGIISDVDDTVLRTYATSRFKLKMLYATFFLDPYERLALEGIDEVLAALAGGTDGSRQNPVFYVSNSPWNIYDNIAEFIQFSGLTRGPIMLRDIGWQMLRKPAFEETHKMQSIRRIMDTFPDLPFVMLGDTAAKDADYYIRLAESYPDRIKAIYIRNNGENKNGRRIAQLIEDATHVEVKIITSSDEILAHARERELIH